VTGSVALEQAPGRLTIDLGALGDNWRALARRAAPGRSAAVVKADAYGIGLAAAAPALWAAGARVFFVAHLSEGLAARRLLPAEAAIYVLNGLERGAEPADYAERRLAPVIGGEEELARWSAFAVRRGRIFRCALHLDTGMNRLGFESLKHLQAAMEGHGAASGADLMMSHFVSSEIAGDPINPAQIKQFEAARAALPGLSASLANSSGMFLLPRAAGATDSRPGAEVAIAGRRCPLVGRISMDLSIVDVTDLPEDAVRAGDRAEFFGSSVDLDDFASRSGTIGYQVLTSLGPRYRREYLR
jgi:alanine racemase